MPNVQSDNYSNACEVHTIMIGRKANKFMVFKSAPYANAPYVVRVNFILKQI